ncbi:restriction endonuclease subunit S [Parabacteroides sp. ZJ-118]|uniref:restriction endonuclease subunit S n=1 Tax=Parabacteroides sp. ZJ-118 TaxID=2709398 RepID=UPI0013EB9785|nr:restriction endonuclease subunit S [Parabacteroides sp. ZJ-118]
MEYLIKHIGDICRKVCSGGTPTSTNALYYEGGTIPWVNTNEVNFCNIYDTNRKITEEGLNHSAAKYIPANSIIVAMYGVTAGKSAIAKIPLTTNQACCNLIIDESQADYRYVYYFLLQQSENLNRLANGGAQQNLNAFIIKKYKITLPVLPIQQKIASILSAYDSLIENNTKRIRMLEQMAENLYKEWFVRFRFPGHEHTEFVDGLPKGWKVLKIKDCYRTCSGGTPSREKPEYYINGSIPWVKTGEIQDSIIIDTEEKITSEALKHSSAKLLPRNSLLMAMYGVNIGKLGILTKQMSCNQAACAFLPNNEKKTFYYLFFYLKSIREYLLIIGFGAAQQNLSQSIINNIRITIPSEIILNDFERNIFVLYKQIELLQRQSALLARQRDLLLPRLMSGKLEVKA